MFLPALLCFLAFFLLCTVTYGQYTGGGDDGFAIAALKKLNITDPNAFKGGIDDGFTASLFNKETTSDGNAFKGGSDDGFTVSILKKLNITDPNAFKGGIDDGFTASLFNKETTSDGNAFKGGADDGFTVSILKKLNITDPNAFKGGIDDGFAVSIYIKGSSLPLTLLDFNGKWMDNTAVLSWQTATETNTSEFVLERSFTGDDDFTDIGTVAASGNSNTLESYSYNDLHVASLNPAHQQFFYRLKTIDKDGELSYSAIIILTRNSAGDFNITLYPNPANNIATIRVEGWTTTGLLTVTIQDMQGRLLVQKKNITSPGKIDTWQLASGQYLVTIYGNDRPLKTIPIIIQH